MIKTEISLTESEYAAATRVASTLGISIEELVRRSLQPLLASGSDAPWMAYAGFIETGHAVSSQRIDQTIY